MPFHVLWLTGFDVSFAAAHKLINQQLHKPFHISFIHISNSLQEAIWISFYLKFSWLPASGMSSKLRTPWIVHSQHIQSLQYIKVRNDYIYMSPQGWEGVGRKVDDFLHWLPCWYPVRSILNWTDTLTCSRGYIHTTDRNINRKFLLKQIRLHVRSGLVQHCSAIGVPMCAYVCLCYVWLIEHMCICSRQGKQMKHGTLLWIVGFC